MKVKISGIILLAAGILTGVCEIPNHLYSELIVKADLANSMIFLLIFGLIMSGIILIGLCEEISEKFEPVPSQFR